MRRICSCYWFIRIIRCASRLVAVHIDIATWESLYELCAILISSSVHFEGFSSGSQYKTNFCFYLTDHFVNGNDSLFGCDR
jgi:hypothetical protein